MNFKLKLLALLLVVMMMFTSCAVSIDTIMQYIPGFGGETTEAATTTDAPVVDDPVVDDPGVEQPVKNLIDIDSFKRADYSKPRSELLAMYTLNQEKADETMALLDQLVAGALPAPDGDPNETAISSEEWDAIYYQFEDRFYYMAQQMTVATIIYYCNTADEEASQRHLDSQEMFYDLQDKYYESLRELYLYSPARDEIFEGWSEQEIQEILEYDPVVLEIKKAIDELEIQFDNLDRNDYYFNRDSVELYKQLTVKRQEIARYYGYDNYYSYASENVYGRDYSAEDLAVFREYIVEYVVPSFSIVYDNFSAYRDMSQKRQETFVSFVQDAFDKTSKNYLLLYLNSLEGEMGEAMRGMFHNRNFIISNNLNSHPTAFCTYLYYDETPFCLFGNEGQSANTMVHEIGHYYADILNNDLRSYDLLETHSQGNEFLFIKYCESQMNATIYSCVRAYNLVNACYTMILATIVDEFEQSIYALDDETIANMTSEDFDAIMNQICEPYGGASWVANNLTDPNTYWRRVAVSNPVYYISYAISAAAAVEIFALAEEDVDAAYAAYTTLVEGVTEEDGFLGALEKAGIYTPFEEEAFKKIAVTLGKK